MRREDLRELHYIAHIVDARSLMIRGIYCYHRAATVGHESFALEEVQRSRECKQVYGESLHDYVNLYDPGQDGKRPGLRRPNAGQYRETSAVPGS